jgi:Chromo (CHRromatin Organisation MOdifier) domain
VNANAYELELPASLKIHPVINISHLKEYRDGTQAFPDRPVPLTRPEPAALDDNGAPAWEVDRLLDHRKVRRGARQVDQYLVEWKGYPVSEATWEPLEHLTGAIDLVREFNQQHAVQLSAVETVLPRTFAQAARSGAQAARSPTRGA